MSVAAKNSGIPGTLGRTQAQVAQIAEHSLLVRAEAFEKLGVIELGRALLLREPVQFAQVREHGLSALRRELPPLWKKLLAHVALLFRGQCVPDALALAQFHPLLRRQAVPLLRSEERRVGKECRSRWS